jgi:transglutaminase-like putative cysteine protease
MRSTMLRPLLLVPAFLALAGFSEGHGGGGPPVVPYVCNDGQPAQVVYEWGGDFLHARALVTLGGRTVEMKAAPTLDGLRYRSEAAAEGGAPLAWSVRGEEAILSAAPTEDSYAGEEQALAQCRRVREGGYAAAHAEGHGGHSGH